MESIRKYKEIMKNKMKHNKIKNALIIFILIEVIIILTFSYKIIFNNKNQTNFEFQGNTIPHCPNCNVILISLDTLRADRMSLYDYYRNTTPNLDEFAKKSIVFDEMYSNAYYTLPSHMSIFTSLYPLTHKINDQGDKPLSSKFQTMAEILKENNYKTIWSTDISGEGQNLGYNYGFNRGFDESYKSVFPMSSNKGLDKEILSKIIENVLDKKFFLFLHSYVNHDPNIYQEEFNNRFSINNYTGKIPKTYDELFELIWMKMKNEFEKHKYVYEINRSLNSEQGIALLKSFELNNSNYFKKTINNIDKTIIQIKPFYLNGINLSNEDILQLSNSYDNGVYYIDYLVNEIVQELEKQNLLNNTIIIIIGDHGQEIFEHKNYGHGNFYNQNIHVPLLIYIPELKEGIRTDKLTESIDVVPTILSIINITTPKQAQGKNILNNKEENKYVYGYTLGMIYIKSKEWKLIQNPNGTEELYNLMNDPKEQNNLINNNTKIKEELENEIIKWETKQSTTE